MRASVWATICVDLNACENVCVRSVCVCVVNEYVTCFEQNLSFSSLRAPPNGNGRVRFQAASTARRTHRLLAQHHVLVGVLDEVSRVRLAVFVAPNQRLLCKRQNANFRAKLHHVRPLRVNCQAQ